MQFLDLTLPTPAENVALDEALLDEAEATNRPSEVLRLWESAVPMVVIGRGSQVALEVDVAACRADGVPVLRRTSGGAAIITGPGCLMYAVVLSYQQRPELRSLDKAHRFVLDTLATALARFSSEVRCHGSSDLAIGDRKFSGNSLRCRRTHFIYHGTLLYDFPLDLVGRYLLQPPRQPQYREGRSHAEFVTNLPADVAQLRQAIVNAWNARDIYSASPEQRVAELVAERYSRDDWNFRH